MALRYMYVGTGEGGRKVRMEAEEYGVEDKEVNGKL